MTSGGPLPAVRYRSRPCSRPGITVHLDDSDDRFCSRTRPPHTVCLGDGAATRGPRHHLAPAVRNGSRCGAGSAITALLLSRQTVHVLGGSRALRAIAPDRTPHRRCCATPDRKSVV